MFRGSEKIIGVAGAVALSATVAVSAQANFVAAGLGGTTSFDAWDELSRSTPQVANANPPFPGFPGNTPWPEAIESVLTQGTAESSDDDPTGDATFNKTSGFGYPAGGSIYSSPFGTGTYIVEDLTPVADLATVVFQIQIGQGTGSGPGIFDPWLTGVPTLTVDTTTAIGISVSPSNTAILSQGIGDSDFGPINIGVLGVQWDVTGISDPITSFGVEFGPSGTSSTILALQLDQSDTFSVAPIPEPTSLALIGLGGLAMLGRTRRYS